MTLDEFENKLTSACVLSPAVASVSIIGTGLTWIRLRAYLVDESFLDAFFNEVTGKTAFALIKGEKRIFGADNTGGNWHWHPFDDPDRHISSGNVIDFRTFLAEVEKKLKMSE
jgi:hypothetical protein